MSGPLRSSSESSGSAAAAATAPSFFCVTAASILVILAAFLAGPVASQTPPGPTNICTVQNDCSNHASSVEFVTDRCVCDCYNSWYGDQCQHCAENYTLTNCSACNTAKGYTGTYPNCVPEGCVSFVDCNFRGIIVGGNKVSGCICDCIAAGTHWTGDTCDVCPPNYEQDTCTECAPGYNPKPNCPLQCTIPANCSDHAESVTGNSETGCNCACENEWQGQSCQNCPAGVNASLDCAACIIGFSGFPNCSRSCTLADCGGNNNTISAKGTEATGCECICKNKYEGVNCTVCPAIFDPAQDCAACHPAYGGFPNCSLKCTNEANCSNHALNVEGTTKTGCTCTCRNKWFGSNCSECPPGFNSTSDCNSCAAGFSGPTCQRECTPALDCNGHASSAQGYAGDCTCHCRNGWRGATCDSCTDPYSGPDCQFCIAGFLGTPPNCKKNCTTRDDCDGHATSVEGFLNGTCKCDCRNEWSNTTCNFCAPRYRPGVFDCAVCAEGYEDYPNCYYKCTNQFNCTGNAYNVTGNDGPAGCTCFCDKQWTGTTCSICPDVYDQDGCDKCATGYVNYPTCTRECTDALDCNSHAVNVSGGAPNCTCNCETYWAGPQCGDCPTKYDFDNNCNACAAAYENFPACYLKCTNVNNCTNHAAQVSGNIVEGCNCTCRKEWYGANCSQCPPLVNASKDCGECIDGYGGYPNCTRICTKEQDCNGHATSVTGLEGDCTCTCRNEWSNSTCDVCPPLYNATQDCGVCIDTRETYPACYLKCTMPANCSGHATAVTGNDGPLGCTCTCRNEWEDGTCSTCQPNYNATEDCGTCAYGYDDYPRCARICTNVTDCSDHASNVSGLFPDCQCTCRNAWHGDSCEYCPPGFRPETDCAACSNGYEGFYPDCYLKCTNAANCSNHAARVTGNEDTGCNCTCRNQWNGTECDNCPEIYDDAPLADCGVCAFGYEGYPDCVRTCTIALDCGGNADNITGVYPNCTCGCRNQWYGDKCERCDPIYNNASDCGTCAIGYEDYPHCFPKCTSRQNCSGHARVVTGNFNTTCNCTCRASWFGEICDQCPSRYDPLEDCAACKFGYLNYPICAPRCGNSDCFNRSLQVTGPVPNCTCLCKNFWNATARCETCPINYNVTNDCLGCSADYEEEPECYRKCTNDLDCAGNAYAVNVSGNVGPRGCNCPCRNFWNVSTNCSTCPINYNASLDCNACAEGYDDFPRCIRKCTSLLDCNNHAVNATGLIPNCTCNCRNKWQNATCDHCPFNFDASRDCGTCAKYYENYPNCTRIVSPTLEPSRTFTISDSESVSASATASAATDSMAASPSTTASVSHSDEAATGTGIVTVSSSFSESESSTATLTPMTDPPTPAPNTTTPAPNTTTFAPETTTMAPTPTTTSAPNTTTAAPNTTIAPTTTSVAPTTTTTTAAPNTTTAAPNTTDAPTTTTVPNTTTAAPNTTTGAPNTTTPAPTDPPAPRTPTQSHTLPDCRDHVECSGHGNASNAGPAREYCWCSCGNRWISSPSHQVPMHSTDGCSICPERYGSSEDEGATIGDCDGCAAGVNNGSTYPNDCLFSAHIIGNWSLPFCDNPKAETVGYLEVLGRDLETAVKQFFAPAAVNAATEVSTPTATAASTALEHACPFPLPLEQSWVDVPADESKRVLPGPTNPASIRVASVRVDKITVLRNVVGELPVFEGEFKRSVLFDIHLQGSSWYGVEAAAGCVAEALSTNAGSLGTAVVAQGGGGQLTPARKTPIAPTSWALSQSASYLGASASTQCITGGPGFSANTSNFTACYPIGCGAPFDNSAMAVGGAEGGGFPFWIIGAIVGGLLVIAVGAFLILRFAAPSVGQKVLPARMFVDGTKYTINFDFKDEMDSEMRLVAQEREIDFDDI